LEERSSKALSEVMHSAAISTTKGLVKRFEKWSAVADPALTPRFLKEVLFSLIFMIDYELILMIDK
jgi:hypothetical protein